MKQLKPAPICGEQTAGTEQASARLQALRATALLDTPPEDRFDRLTRLASITLHAPVALVSLVDEDRQFFKSCVGLDEPMASLRQTPLTHSFCRYAVASGQPLIINDAREHALVKDNPSVREMGVIAYAGIPLITESGYAIGSFCVLDTQPRQWTDEQISILKDLAASVMTEIDLQSAKDAAVSASHAKDQFLAVLSHELRTPLSPALMIATAMADDVSLPAQAREDAAIIRRNIEQQTRLIDDLLDITRIENNKLALHPTTVDVNDLLRESIAMCAGGAATKQIAISFEPHARRHTIHGDPVRLRQVFCNLLNNAIKFTPQGGRITLRTNSSKESLRITVQDTGIGVSADVLPTLFRPFAQGTSTRTHEFGGLGLGLAICKGIVEGHNGIISAHSEGNLRGTTMAVELPTVQEPLAADPPTTEPMDAGPRPVSILLVDDHEDTLRAMSRLLRKLEHRVVTADCVQSALRAADTEKFDLLISDLGLPDGTGLDLMRELITRQPIRGIALTGYGSDNDHRQTREAGFSAHLTKPIDLHALQGAIRTIADENN